ncbi:MAG: hypothetical protein K6A65_06825 [Succinivibrionaceae bacterium]|nr:hypothetical protein [Succinivibrionaceae bacterium]
MPMLPHLLPRAPLLALALLLPAAGEAGLWETGELTYPSGEAEVAAFVNTEGDAQLQVVMCTRNEPLPWRFSLLLPSSPAMRGLVRCEVEAGERVAAAYAEVVGNTLEFQLDEEVVISLTDIPSLCFRFEEQDARELGLPAVLPVDLQGADLNIRHAAAECAVRCTSGDYACNRSLVSSLLWPRLGPDPARVAEIGRLCSGPEGTEHPAFVPSETCKLALDRLYEHDGQGPLSFIRELFSDEKGSYAAYRQQWNELAALAVTGPTQELPTVDDTDWYLFLYACSGAPELRNFPASFHSVMGLDADPTTLLYDIDSRYELEILKYTAVFLRRNLGRAGIAERLAKALGTWQDFYREFTTILPKVKLAKATRPIMYRQMLMRLWRLSGMPEGLHYSPEHAFRQGTGGRTLTRDPLEANCSIFDGERGDQFFHASAACVRGIDAELRGAGLIRGSFEGLRKSWDEFARLWSGSIFYSDSLDDAVGSELASGFALTTLSMHRIYGFGDYFLLRECISSEDSDICALEADRAYDSYRQELRHLMEAISKVSVADATTLRRISELWERYYAELRAYLGALRDSGMLDLWKVELVRGVAAMAQANAIINASYNREAVLDDD